MAIRKTGRPGVEVYVSSRRRWRGKPERCYYIRYRNSTGKTVREKVGWESEGVTLAAAVALRAERVRAIRLGEDVVTIQERRRSALTLREFVEKHYAPWARNKKSWRREDGLLRLWILPELGDLALADIRARHVERLKAKVLAQRSPRTTQYALAVVRQIFNRARDWDLFHGENPVRRVKSPRFDNRRTRYLSPAEAQALLAAAKKTDEDLFGFCLLALYCGLRAGEIRNLRWEDVDLEKDLLHVRDAKSGEGRTLPLPATVKEMLASRSPERAAPDRHVFPGRYGGRRKGVPESFFRVVEDLGFNDGIEDPRQKVVFHTLRHTFASLLASQGVSLPNLAELLGHKTLTMVRRYSHLSPEGGRVAIQALERVLTEEKASRRRS